jgi:hypothetical protein
MECSIDGCDGAAKTRGWCQAHYMRWYTTGSTGVATIVRRPRGRTCSVPGCERKHSGRGLCDAHLQRLRAHGDPGNAQIEARRPGATCSVEGCENPHEGRGLCNKHLIRERSTGDPLTPLPEHGPNWTGDDATYNAVHHRVRADRGSASAHDCVSCGAVAEHWSYDHLDRNQKTDLNGRPYSTDLSRYRPMCQPCHRRYDVEFMTKVTCSVDGCSRQQKARGLCSKHYQAARKASL